MFSIFPFAEQRLVTKREYDNDIFMEDLSWPAGNEAIVEQDVSVEASGGGVSYIRWGRTVCPSGAEMVYVGRAAGSYYSHPGGGSNYQCVTLQPKNLSYTRGTSTAVALIYGSEYQTYSNTKLRDHDVPCVVCYVPTRTAKIMIPGTYECPARWTREYEGFLMTAYYRHYRTTFECVDRAAEVVEGSRKNIDGALFFYVEPRCGSLPCPPYDEQKEMTCAVCTR